jgi:hypothetical protein
VGQGQKAGAAKGKGQVGNLAPSSQSKSKGKGNTAQPAGAAAGAECFKCGRQGHFQSACTFDPICVLCGGEGHASANCPTRGKTLRL